MTPTKKQLVAGFLLIAAALTFFSVAHRSNRSVVALESSGATGLAQTAAPSLSQERGRATVNPPSPIVSPDTAIPVVAPTTVAIDPALDRFRFGTRWGREDQKELAAFSAWATRYTNEKDPAVRDTMKAEGLDLAKTRRSVLKGLIETEPKSALAGAVPFSIRSQLPQEIQDQLEKRVSGKGDLLVLGASPRPDGRGVFRSMEHRAKIEGQTYQAFPFANTAQLPTTRGISIHGVALDRLLAVADTSVRLLDLGELPSADKAFAGGECPVSGKSLENEPEAPVVESGDQFYKLCDTKHAVGLEGKVDSAEGGRRRFGKLGFETDGSKRLLWMRVDFPDVPGDPISLADANAGVLSLGEFFLKNSYGKFQLSNSAVTPVMRMPKASTNYSGVSGGDEELLTDARAAAKAIGFDTANFNLDLVMFGDIGFQWGGLGYVGAKGSWVQGSSLGTSAHELGHNFGLNHSGLWVSTNIIGPGRRIEYGNAFSTLGKADAYPQAHFTVDAKTLLKWLPPGNVHTATAAGVVRLYAHDLAGRIDDSKIYAIKVPAGKSVEGESVDYWVEFRQLFTENETTMNGALVLWGNDVGSQKASSLLDMTPGSQPDVSDADDAALLVGRTFSDQGLGVSIQVQSKGGTGAERYLDVAVSLGSSSISLADALDAPAFSWRTDGATNWVGVADVTKDGTDAARSGTIGDNQSSWIEATITGPGSLSFWWKVSSEANSDWLDVMVDGAAAADRISGASDWQQKTITVTPGAHVVRWSYRKDASDNQGADAGWVDQVVFAASAQPPRITYQPANVTVAVGHSTTLSVAASGADPLQYQWRKNDAAVLGATNVTFVLAAAQVSDSGAYSVQVSNDAGVATSSNAVITVIPPVTLEAALDTTSLDWTTGGDDWLGQTVISRDGQDAAQTITTGDGNESWLQTTVTGPGTLGFWWKVSSEANRDFLQLQIDGANQPGGISGEVDWQKRTIILSPETHTVRWTYTKDSTGRSGQDRAWVDQVTFNHGGSPPLIITQPVDVSAPVGGNTQFTVAASGTQPILFQWIKDGRPLLTGTNATLGITDVQPELAGAYTVQIINGAGSITSRTANLTVSGIVSLAEAFDTPGLVWTTGGTGPWNGQTAVTHDQQDAGQSLQLQDKQESWIQTTFTGPGTLSFWWKVSSEPDYDVFELLMDNKALANRISGEEDWTKPSVAIPAGVHTLRWRFAKDGSNSAGKDLAWLDEVAFVAVGSSPSITLHPHSVTATLGNKVVFSVAAASDSVISYQWRKAGSDLPGAVNATYTVESVSAADAGAYDVVVTNPNGFVTSQTATLTVLASLSLEQALDGAALVWTTGGASPWLPQTAVTHDTFHAAASGTITNSQESWMETTLTGPVEVSFWWKISSEEGYDLLELLLDGTVAGEAASGENHWRQHVTVVPAGTHTLRWRYKKDETASAGQDRAWVDQVSVTTPQKPANDNFADRLPISATSATASGSNVSATKETGEPAHGANPGGRSLWWTWTETVDRRIVLTTEGSTLDTLLAVYTGTSLNALTLVAESDDINEDNKASRATFDAKAGTVYQIAVDGYRNATNAQATASSGVISLLIGEPPRILTVTAAPQANPALGQSLSFTVEASSATPLTYQWFHNDYGFLVDGGRIRGATLPTLTITNAQLSDEGTYSVLVANPASAELSQLLTVFFAGTTRPANDSFLNASELTGNAASAEASNTTATPEADEPYHADTYGGRSLWWKWTAPSAGLVNITTAGSSFNTLLAVYQGQVLTNLTTVASSDDIDDTNKASALSFTAVANTTYHIAVDGFQDQSGTVAAGQVHLQVSLGGGPATTAVRWRHPVLDASGRVEFAFEDPQGAPFTAADLARFEIQTSTNLSDWTPFAATPIVTSGRIGFTTDPSITGSLRFYRVKSR